MFSLDFFESKPAAQADLRAGMNFRNVVELDGARIREDHRPFDDIAKLTQISRPVVTIHRSQGFRRKGLRLFARVRSKEFEMQQGETLDILRAFAQCGEAQGNHVESIIEILA